MHDASYKALFSHARMVEDLLRGFVPQAWVQELDFASLEKLNASYVADDLRHRHGDVVWRVRFREHWLYVYLLLEFQSTVDTFMAVRLLSYTSLLYQDLIRTEQLSAHRKLPAVLPIVLYNGEPRWTAAVEVAELQETVPLELKAYQPQQRYLLLDEGAFSEAELAPLQNLVAAVFRLENSRSPQAVLVVISALIEWLQQPEQISLRRAFTVWIKRVVLAEADTAELSEHIIELEEVRTMLAQRVQQWKREWRESGFAEGLERGLAAERQMLVRQTRIRFGGVIAEQLSQLLNHIHDAEQLAQIGEWLMASETGDRLLVQVRALRSVL